MRSFRCAIFSPARQQAAAACGQWCLDQTHQPDYVRALIDAGIEMLSIGFTRPDIDDIAGAGPVAPGAADPLAVMARLLRAADTK